MKILLVGIGNILMSDDGIGVRAIELLSERYRFPEEVTVLDGGTLGLSLLPHVQNVDRLIVIDAVDTGSPPGTLVRLAGEEIPRALESKLSPHQLGLKDLLGVASLLGCAPGETVICGVQPASVQMGMDLSPSVQAQLESLVESVLQQLAAWSAEPAATVTRATIPPAS